MVLILLAALPLIGGCATQESAAVSVTDYSAAFTATKEILRENNFVLDRLDARTGVVTTRPKTTGGIATPWDGEQSTPGQEFQDLVNRQAREVRVTFSRPTGTLRGAARTGTTEELTTDLRDGSGPVTVRVVVNLIRRQRPGWRVDSRAINLSSYTSDPELAERRMEPAYDSVVGRDDLLAGRLAQEIAERVGAGEGSTESGR